MADDVNVRVMRCCSIPRLFDDVLREHCALMLGFDYIDNLGTTVYVISRVLVVPNANEDKHDTYGITMGWLNKIRSMANDPEELIGAMHTHTQWDEIDPSERDLEKMPLPLLGAVYNPNHQSLVYWAKGIILGQERRVAAYSNRSKHKKELTNANQAPTVTTNRDNGIGSRH